MFAAGSTAEVAVHHKDRCPLKSLLVKGVLTLEFTAIIREHLVTQGIETHTLEKAGRDDPIGVDVLAADDQGSTRHLFHGTGREAAHQTDVERDRVRTSVTWP